MSRGRSSRRRRAEPRSRPAHGGIAYQTEALLLIASFVIGAVLEWVRTQPKTADWSWRSDVVAILLAAWVSVALLAWWPRAVGRRLATSSGMMLLVLFVGMLVMHTLINGR